MEAQKNPIGSKIILNISHLTSNYTAQTNKRNKTLNIKQICGSIKKNRKLTNLHDYRYLDLR